jgi:uncharacterized protein YjdB
MYVRSGFTRLLTSRHFRREKEKAQKPPPARTQDVHTKMRRVVLVHLPANPAVTNALLGFQFSKQGQFELEEAVRREVREFQFRKWNVIAFLAFASVAQAQAAKITISPKTATVEVGKTKQLSRIVTVVWTSSDTTIATVSQTGLVTPQKPGIVRISVSAGPTLIATSTVTIIPAAVASVQVVLGKSQLAVGEKTTATAIVRDAAGSILTGRVVTWSSSNPSVATVTASPTVMLPPKPQRVAFDWVVFDWPGKK